MIVIADTSPLNYLIRLGHQDMLFKLYGRVLVPHAVLIELSHPQAPAEVRAWVAAPPPWLEVAQVKLMDQTLPSELGVVEREAISLALEVQADLLLIDERAGRQHAEARHIAVAGTLAILLDGALRGSIDLPGALKQLHHYGFRSSSTVEAGVLDRYERAKKAKS